MPRFVLVEMDKSSSLVEADQGLVTMLPEFFKNNPSHFLIAHLFIHRTCLRVVSADRLGSLIFIPDNLPSAIASIYSVSGPGISLRSPITATRISRSSLRIFFSVSAISFRTAIFCSSLFCCSVIGSLLSSGHFRHGPSDFYKICEPLLARAEPTSFAPGVGA